LRQLIGQGGWYDRSELSFRLKFYNHALRKHFSNAENAEMYWTFRLFLQLALQAVARMFWPLDWRACLLSLASFRWLRMLWRRSLASILSHYTKTLALFELLCIL
jgi:hypothetical protein